MYPGMGPTPGQRQGFPPPHQTPQMMQNFPGRQPLPPHMTPYGPPPPRNGGGMRNSGTPRSGGLLSKILGGRSAPGTQGAMNTASQAASATGSRSIGGAGILQTITNPTNISGFLTNTQKFLNTAGQLGPMVQQYGPMVKNIPSMWKLYRGLKNMSSSTEEEENDSSSSSPLNESPTTTASVDIQKKKIVPTETSKEKPMTKPAQKIEGQSLPKLYI